jgi:hypothetical protein
MTGHHRHCSLEHGLSRLGGSAVARSRHDGSRRISGPPRTARVGAHRPDRRLRLDCVRPRRAVSAAEQISDEPLRLMLALEELSAVSVFCSVATQTPPSRWQGYSTPGQEPLPTPTKPSPASRSFLRGARTSFCPMEPSTSPNGNASSFTERTSSATTKPPTPPALHSAADVS